MSSRQTSGSPAPTRVFMLEDHTFFVEGSRMAYRQRGDLEIVGHATNLAEARCWIESRGGPEAFDLAVVDLMLPDGNGVEFVRELRKQHPAVKIAVLSAENDLGYALEAGADRAFSKHDSLSRILEGLLELAASESD